MSDTIKKICKEYIPYVIVIIVVLLFKHYFFAPVRVNGASMDDTLKDKQILLLNIIDYKLNDNIKRFDIVVIDNEDEFLIKRIIGLPGDIVRCVDNKLYINGKEIKEGDVLDVTMDHYAWGELVAHVFLKNNADEAKDFTVKEVRNYDYVKYVPSFCVTMCNTSNGQKEELWTVGSLEAEQEQELAMHLRVSNYAEVDGEYVEVFQETATCPGVFTVSNGEESLTFTLNFVYVKEEVPAE